MSFKIIFECFYHRRPLKAREGGGYNNSLDNFNIHIYLHVVSQALQVLDIEATWAVRFAVSTLRGNWEHCYSEVFTTQFKHWWHDFRPIVKAHWKIITQWNNKAYSERNTKSCSMSIGVIHPWPNLIPFTLPRQSGYGWIRMTTR